MKIREVDLPGIGRKYTFLSVEGDKFVIIIHHSGRREIYVMADPEDDEPVCTINLNDEEARRVGSIMLGADYQPVSPDRMELVMKSLFVEWFRVTSKSPLANKKIKETRIKDVTGATIIGIQRGDTIIGSPSAEEVLLPDDLLMVIGKREQLRSLDTLCKEQGLCKG